MFESFSKRRATATAMLAALSLLLTGCFVTPGKFVSELTLKTDNSFAFSYQGEVFFMGLTQLAMMAEGAPEFEAYCYDENEDPRDCNDSETAEQRAEWDADAADRKREQDQQAKQMASVLGGVDPTDPDAGNELARKLERQRGWNRVEYVSAGKFNVDYAISGTLSHDITFPVIEGVPVPAPFVQVILRDDNQVRVNAPGFSNEQQGGSNGLMTGMMTGMMGGLMQDGMAEGPNGEQADPMSQLSKMEGSFTVVTNGQILANNTDEGPSAVTAGQSLNWNVDMNTKAAPTALIKLAQ